MSLTDVKPRIPKIRIAKAIFWMGTLASLGVLLAMTVHTHASFTAVTRADALDDHVVAGMHAFEDSPNRWRRSTELLLAKASMTPAAALVELESCLACHALGNTEGNVRHP